MALAMHFPALARDVKPTVAPDRTPRIGLALSDTAALSWWKCGLASNGRTHLVRVEFSAMNPNGAGFGPRTLAIRYDQ